MSDENENQHDDRNDELVAAIDEKWAQWKRPLAWTLGFVGILVLYVFVYPLSFWLIDKFDSPDWIVDSMEKTAFPLIWMDDNFEPYTDYIKWLEDNLD